ncbi:lysA, partial [Symbiodinium sp. KB8]
MAEPTAEFGKEVVPASPGGWWKDQSIQKQLLSLPLTPQGLYVYHLATVKNQCRSILTAMQFAYRQATPSGAAPEEMADKFWSQCQPFYAMKANPHPDLVTAIASHGIGIECVSAAEIRHARRLVGSAHPILFTPNFCDASEYGDAFALGADVTVDGPDILRVIPDTFAGREIGVRIDPGAGEGHHAKVMPGMTYGCD